MVDSKKTLLNHLLLEKASSFVLYGEGFTLRVSNDTDESPEGEWVIHRYFEDPWYRTAGRDPAQFRAPSYLAQKNESGDRTNYWAPWASDRNLDDHDFWYPTRFEDLHDALALATQIAAGEVKVFEDPCSEDGDGVTVDFTRVDGETLVDAFAVKEG